MISIQEAKVDTNPEVLKFFDTKFALFNVNEKLDNKPLTMKLPFLSVNHLSQNINENMKALDEFMINLDNNRKLSLIHGDIHLNNMIIDSNGLYFIDWELATYGDIAYELVMHFILMKYNEIEKNKFIDKLCENLSINKQNLINDIEIYEKSLS